MTCTLYNDPSFTYNAPINYNGVCVTPPVPGGGGGGVWNFEPRPVVAFPSREDEEVAVALILNQLMLDDE